eukprot:ANDGO_03698.mRNA.1 hypothetical protein
MSLIDLYEQLNAEAKRREGVHKHSYRDPDYAEYEQYSVFQRQIREEWSHLDEDIRKHRIEQLTDFLRSTFSSSRKIENSVSNEHDPKRRNAPMTTTTTTTANQRADETAATRPTSPQFPPEMSSSSHLVSNSLLHPDRAAELFGRRSALSEHDIHELRSLEKRHTTAASGLSAWEAQRLADLLALTSVEQEQYRNSVREKVLQTNSVFFTHIHPVIDKFYEERIAAGTRLRALATMSDRYGRIGDVAIAPTTFQSSMNRKTICLFGRCPVFRAPPQFPVPIDVPSVSAGIDRYLASTKARLPPMHEDPLLIFLCQRYNVNTALCGSAFSALCRLRSVDSLESLDLPVHVDCPSGIAFVQKPFGARQTTVRDRCDKFFCTGLKHALMCPPKSFDPSVQPKPDYYQIANPQLLAEPTVQDALFSSLSTELNSQFLPSLRCMYAYTLCENGDMRFIVRHKLDAFHKDSGRFIKFAVHTDLAPQFGPELRSIGEAVCGFARSYIFGDKECSMCFARVSPPDPSDAHSGVAAAKLWELEFAPSFVPSPAYYDLESDKLEALQEPAVVATAASVVSQIQSFATSMRGLSSDSVNLLMSRDFGSPSVAVSLPWPVIQNSGITPLMTNITPIQTQFIYGLHSRLDASRVSYLPPMWHSTYGPVSHLFPLKLAEPRQPQQPRLPRLPLHAATGSKKKRKKKQEERADERGPPSQAVDEHIEPTATGE